MGNYDLDKVNADPQSRIDLEVIDDVVEPGNRVLDLGCGDGAFLMRLAREKQADVLGIEKDLDNIARCIANGVPVVQSDLDHSLDFVEDDSFDVVILSRTIQELRRADYLLEHIVRVGRKAAISVINFAHWRCRLQLLAGRMPRNPQIPYQWYDTPNIHHGTIVDFRELCDKLGIEILQETPIPGLFPKLSKLMPNLFAIGAVFVISKK